MFMFIDHHNVCGDMSIKINNMNVTQLLKTLNKNKLDKFLIKVKCCLGHFLVK